MSDVTTTTPTPITPKALAEELGVNPKVLRAYLRRAFTRDAEVKGQSWIITPDAADAAREKFAKNETQPATEEAPAQA